MLLSAVIICCMIVVNAEPPLNSYSFTGDSNGYNNNGYLGSKDNYQNGGSFYGAGDTSHKLSNHVSGSLINAGNQGNVGGDAGKSYDGYSANDHGSEYAGYSNTYAENSDGDSYTRATSTPSFRGYSGSNNNGESAFNAYSSDPAHKDADFGQYAASSSNNGKRIPAYPGYSRPTALDSYPEGSVNGDVQRYPGTSGSSYSESDHAYSAYSPGDPTGEYSFGKQKNDPYNLKGGNKHGDIYAIQSETRYTRGNAGHASHNRDLPSYMSSSGPSVHFAKAHGSNVWYSPGKPSKYSYKHPSRYAPNSGMAYLTRDRDGYYVPYGKGGGKVIIIKDRPSYDGHIYSDESPYAGGYRSKSGGFMSGYSVSPNFLGYNYDDGSMMLRRYRNTGGPVLVQKRIAYS